MNYMFVILKDNFSILNFLKHMTENMQLERQYTQLQQQKMYN